jgi:hypothetical protein
METAKVIDKGVPEIGEEIDIGADSQCAETIKIAFGFSISVEVPQAHLTRLDHPAEVALRGRYIRQALRS